MGRKVRSDKKKEIKPVLPLKIKDLIYQLNYITQTPVKDVCEWLCIEVLSDRDYINYLSQFFVRDIWIGNTLYCGDIDNKYSDKRLLGFKGRVTIKFKQPTYEMIAMLSYAMDCTPSRMVAILLEMATKDVVIVNKYILRFLKDNLTKHQMKELRSVLTQINRNNHTNSGWASLLSYIVDNSKASVVSIKEAIEDFLKQLKS